MNTISTPFIQVHWRDLSILIFVTSFLNLISWTTVERREKRGLTSLYLTFWLFLSIRSIFCTIFISETLCVIPTIKFINFLCLRFNTEQLLLIIKINNLNFLRHINHFIMSNLFFQSTITTVNPFTLPEKKPSTWYDIVISPFTKHCKKDTLYRWNGN